MGMYVGHLDAVQAANIGDCWRSTYVNVCIYLLTKKRFSVCWTKLLQIWSFPMRFVQSFN